MIEDKDDVLRMVGEALSELGRDDGIYSYGVVDESLESGRQLIYFDLPRISPLQFNIRLDHGLSRDKAIAFVKEAIKRRLDISAQVEKTFEL